MREKETILFNKNHIKIILKENVEIHKWDLKNPDSMDPAEFYVYSERTERQISDDEEFVEASRKHKAYIDKLAKWIPQIKTVKCESPLGFYYAKNVIVNEDKKPEYVPTPSPKIHRFISYKFMIKDKYYELIYPTSSGLTRLSTEVHPWELIDKGMPEHFIFDLKNILDEMFASCVNAGLKEITKIGYSYNSDTKWSGKSARDIQLDVYKDIFGYPEGPKFQTNEEKIIAAGFDLKTSFRKDKESK